MLLGLGIFASEVSVIDLTFITFSTFYKKENIYTCISSQFAGFGAGTLYPLKDMGVSRAKQV